MKRRTRFALAALMALVAAVGAAEEIPKAALKALGLTRGKPVETGLVFFNGHYMPPPYVVERAGTGLRINKTVMLGQVVTWADFLKTQSGVKVTRTGGGVADASSPAAASPEPQTTDEALEDLFSDTPKPKAKAGAKAAKAAPRKVVPTVTYSLEGEFEMNKKALALKARVNAERTSVDALLRRGGFVFFGDTYSKVTGDAKTADFLLTQLPELLRTSTTAEAFTRAVRDAGLVFLPEALCRDLFRNKIDYLALKRRCDEEKLKKVLN